LANIGLFCLISGLLIFDIDLRHCGWETFDLLVQSLGKLPRTVHCLTGGGGAHLYFLAPENTAVLGSLGKGVDVKLNGYVLLPPSMHPSGTPYVWKKGQGPGEIEVASLPSRWLEFITKQPVKVAAPATFCTALVDGSSRYGMAALRRECEMLRTCMEGMRNNQLNLTAFCVAQLAAGGELDPEPARSEVLRAALQSGLDERRALRTLQSGWEAGWRGCDPFSSAVDCRGEHPAKTIS